MKRLIKLYHHILIFEKRKNGYYTLPIEKYYKDISK